jgi:hypothetical protein
MILAKFYGGPNRFNRNTFNPVTTFNTIRHFSRRILRKGPFIHGSHNHAPAFTEGNVCHIFFLWVLCG